MRLLDITHFFALLFAISLIGRPCAAAELPNIIIVFADDQGYQDLGCFGSPNIKTPNIDSLAKDGMKVGIEEI